MEIEDLTKKYDHVWLVPRSKEFMRGMLHTLGIVTELSPEQCIHAVNDPKNEACIWAFNASGEDVEIIRGVVTAHG